MKKILLLSISIFFVNNFLSAQLVAFVGVNENNPDGFAIVALQAIPSGTVIYFTTEEYSDVANAFVDNSPTAIEDLIKWTAPSGVDVGDVIVFSESVSTANSFNLSCSDGTGVTCGATTFSGVGFNFAGTDELYAFSDTDDNPINGITEIYSALQSNGSLTADENPSTDYPSAIVLNITQSIGYIEFNGDRTALTNPAVFGDLSNFTVSGSGNTTLSTTAFSGGFLPVELTYFTGVNTKGGIELNWKTATELNNDYFSIQKSTNGKDFQEIATEQGAGTTYEAQSYSVIDERPTNGINYYRLKQIDYDGQFAFSEVISVDFRADTDISIAPNPVKDRLNITNVEAWAGTVELLVFAVNGQLVQSVQYDNPDHSIALDIQDLRAGLYHVQIISNNQTVTQRFVKN